MAQISGRLGSKVVRASPVARRSLALSCALSTRIPVLRRRELLALTLIGLTDAGCKAAKAKEPRIVETAPAVVPGERALALTSTGIRLSDLKQGSGDKAKTGELVIIDLVGRTEDGKVFLDTREAGKPLAFEVGQTNKFITEGLSQVVEAMRGGDMRLAVVPAQLGYGKAGATLPQGSVPANAKLYYEVELLRCQKFTMGLACCSEESFPCIGKNKPGEVDPAKKAT